MKRFLVITILMFSVTLFSQIADKVSKPTPENVGSLLSSELESSATQSNSIHGKTNGERKTVIFGGEKVKANNLKFGTPLKSEQEKREELKKNNLDIFLRTKNLAVSNYKNKEYSKCVSNYEVSEKTGFTDAELNFVAGASYYKIFEQISKQEYKNKAEKLLKKADEKGFSKAKVFLSKYFGGK